MVHRAVTIAFATLFLLAFSTEAKHPYPATVTPVVFEGIRYWATGDGRNRYLIAEDVLSGKFLWKVKVFHIRTWFWIEEDRQYVFITNLKIVGRSVLVRDERARCYMVELRNKHVKRRECAGNFSACALILLFG